MIEWKPLPHEVVAYETAVENALKLRQAHTLLTEVISSLRHFDDHGGELFADLLHIPRTVSKAQEKMEATYRDLRERLHIANEASSPGGQVLRQGAVAADGRIDPAALREPRKVKP